MNESTKENTMKLTMPKKTKRVSKTVSLLPENALKLFNWARETGFTTSELVDAMIAQTTLDDGAVVDAEVVEDKEEKETNFEDFEG
jgi:hypothetical protein